LVKAIGGFGLFWLATERTGLDHFLAEDDVSEAEATADEEAIPEDLANVVWPCIGAHVEIFGVPAQEQIPHTSADKIRGIACG